MNKRASKIIRKMVRARGKNGVLSLSEYRKTKKMYSGLSQKEKRNFKLNAQAFIVSAKRNSEK